MDKNKMDKNKSNGFFFFCHFRLYQHKYNMYSGKVIPNLVCYFFYSQI